MGGSPLGPGGTSDSVTIARSLEHPERFAMIFDRHYNVVHRYLARRVPRAYADDLASMTFVVAFERRRCFRTDTNSARPWLLGIATNLLRERLRLDRREQGTLLLLGARHQLVGHGADGDADGTPDTDRLAGALATLDPAQRDVLLLHAWEELSYAEIAEALEAPVGTVRSRLARARAHLRSQLEEPRSVSRPDPCKEQR